jgi:DNA helicase II / ATP-dependent DNA helicase PcrA
LSKKEDFFDRKKKEFGVSLNEAQKRAVLQTEGTLLLLASPGSGKTTTTIMRIGYLIEEKGVSPSRIKAVTFSKAAASDMKKRFTRFFPNHPRNSMDFSTIHSLSLQVVKEYLTKINTTYEVLEEKKKKQILKDQFKSIVGEKITDEQMEELTTYITLIKNKLLPEEEWSTFNCEIPKVQQIFKKYEDYKKTGTGRLLMDFDDMLTIANEALEKDRLLLCKYQQKYDYFLTDESQDTSMVQHSIIEKLVQKHGNLYMVADDDQSIYAWRGAEPEYLLNFKQVYPHAEILMMEQNYRSSKDIVNVANQFIKQNKNRFDKNMFTENTAQKPIVIKDFADYTYQSKYLVEKMAEVENFKDVAVLFRNNSAAITIINEFDRAGIPFYIKDHDIRFFSHWVVKDVLNFMRLSFNDKRCDIFENIYTKLNLFISKNQIAQIKQVHNNQSVFDNLLTLSKLNDFQVILINNCQNIFKMMKGITPLQAIRMIRYDLGYEDKLINMSEELGFSRDFLIGILYTLEEIADPLGTMEEFASRLKYLESIMNAAKDNKNQNVVTLSSLHSSKGLEFMRVYMVDLIQGIIPSKDDSKQSEAGNTLPLEEAVRLFYVGMTRAEQHLELLSYRKQYGKEVIPSQFVTTVRDILSPPVQKAKKDTLKRRATDNRNHQHFPNSTGSSSTQQQDRSWKKSTSRLTQEIEDLLQKQNEQLALCGKSITNLKSSNSKIAETISYEKGIEDFIETRSNPVFLVSEVCQYLIKSYQAPSEKYQSGKYKIYPNVIREIEVIVSTGYLEFAGDKGIQDRYYKKIIKETSTTEKEVAPKQISLFD